VTAPPFNDYDESGMRVNRHGNRSSITADIQIVSNLRFAHGDAIAHLNNASIVNAYDDFYWSDMYGDNDARFPEFVKNWE